jgi:hypothetical protein
MAIFKSKINNKCGDDATKQDPYILLYKEYIIVSTTIMESSMEISQKAKRIELPCDPVIPLLGIYPKEYMSGYSRDTYVPMFTAALFTIVKLWKQPRCPTTDEWIKIM